MKEVSLKKVGRNDIELIRQWRNSDLINNVSFSEKKITEEMQKKWYEKVSEEKNFLHWMIISNGKAVGYAAIRSIDIQNSRCEFASLYLGDEDALGTGVGAIAEFLVIEYVYEHYNLRKIYCEVLETNPKVILLHKKFGFEIEGVLKDHYKKGEAFTGVCLLGLFKENWDKKKLLLQKILFKK